MKKTAGFHNKGVDVPNSRVLRKQYESPVVTRVDLALEETMSKGCKLSDDAACVGPPIATFDGGS